MKNITYILALFLFATSASAQQAAAPEPDDVYFIAQLQIEDMEAFQGGYFPGVGPKLMEAGAIVLAATPQPGVIEGEWVSNWSVIIRFDDQETFDRFWNDPEYQDDLAPIRRAATSVNNIVVLSNPAN